MRGQGMGRRLLTGSASSARLAVLAIVLLLLTAVFPVDADASSVTFSGPTSFSVGYSFVTPGGDPLTANSTFNVTSFSSTEVLLGVTINNTTPNYVLSSMGFNTNPAVTASYTSTGSKFDGIGNNVNFPGFQTIEVCAFTSANCSSATNPQALQPNSSDSFGLKLTGNFTPQSLTLSTFAIRFAGGPGGSFTFQGAVPVPGTLLLFGVGFAALMAWQYRSRFRVSTLA